MSFIDIFQVLREEAEAAHGVRLEGETPQDVYRNLQRLESNAICLSGGGIRSAAYALGVLQSLASREDGGKNEVSAGPLLSQFHYLSTVSGGGFIGGWLMAWLKRASSEAVLNGLNARTDLTGGEIAPLRWLRANSNYLTPRLSLLSGDGLTALALSIRNLVLNWLVFVPIIVFAIITVKIFGLVSNWTIFWVLDPGTSINWSIRDKPEIIVKLFIETAALFAAVGSTVFSLVVIGRSRPTRCRDNNFDPLSFFFKAMLPAFLGAFFLVHFICSDLFGNILLKCSAARHPIAPLGDHPFWSICWPDSILRVGGHTTGWNQLRFDPGRYLACGAIGGMAVYGFSWLVSITRSDRILDFFAWIFAGAIFGVLIASGAMLYLQMPDEGFGDFPVIYLQIIFGIPWVIFSEVLSEMIFVGFTVKSERSDLEREWFGYASGWYLLVAFCVFAGSFLIFLWSVLEVLLPRYVYELLRNLAPFIPLVAAFAGITTAVLVRRPSRPLGDKRSSRENLLFQVAAVVFCVAGLVVLSSAIDQVLLGEGLAQKLPREKISESTWPVVKVFALALFSSGIWAFAASRCININLFSLHSIYRNRIVRTFLGASNAARAQDPLVGFDDEDNPPMASMQWNNVEPLQWRPFHVVNTALNMLSSKNLAWQERKAASFTITSLHCGAAILGFRKTAEYGGSGGVTLGTALAISGAAASPNMGSYSSSGKTFFMTLFNMRLGSWLGNPGPAGAETYDKSAPKFALGPWLHEALGLTTETSEYVYLSDGGHFENLGLYEMVRRRCRRILVVDAGHDPEFKFGDLGNAIQKIRVDLDVNIRMFGIEKMKPRSEAVALKIENQSFMIGEIEYGHESHKNGVLIYIKPCLTGRENISVRAFASAHASFPHESTANQWFGETRFEAYRMLGFEAGNQVKSAASKAFPMSSSIDELFIALRRGAVEQAGDNEMV